MDNNVVHVEPGATQPLGLRPSGWVALGCNLGAGTTQTQTKGSIPIITWVLNFGRANFSSPSQCHACSKKSTSVSQFVIIL